LRIVEATKHESVLRQAAFAARRRALDDGAAVVVDLIRSRKPHHAFGIERVMIFGDHRGVGEDVVHVRSARRARIAEIVHLNGRGAACQHTQTVILGKTHEIDGDVDFGPAHQRGDLLVAVVADINEMLERRLKAPPRRRIVILSERQRGDLETRFVVLLEQAGRQVSGRVLVEVGRKIGDAKAVVGIDLALPERRKGRLLFHVTPGALQLLGGR
jgi:hypothetical protein